MQNSKKPSSYAIWYTSTPTKIASGFGKAVKWSMVVE
jgi:hypothetical protein